MRAIPTTDRSESPSALSSRPPATTTSIAATQRRGVREYAHNAR